MSEDLIRRLREAVAASGPHDIDADLMEEAANALESLAAGFAEGVEAAIYAAEGERLETKDHPEDVAYDLAIDHIVTALKDISPQGGWRVSEGWRLVPETATPEMIGQGQHAYDKMSCGLVDGDDPMAEAWSRMLAAAPAPTREG